MLQRNMLPETALTLLPPNKTGLFGNYGTTCLWHNVAEFSTAFRLLQRSSHYQIALNNHYFYSHCLAGI